MELQFQKTIISCMQPLAQEMQNQELTQEVRLTDEMPDIGKVLGCWGQLLVRSKEWRAGNVGASGGVMVWVLYSPEDGSAVQSVATWVPFQMKWDIPETQRDGTIQMNALLRGIDARSVSARKIMVRAGIGIVAETMVPGEVEIYQPAEIPEDVHLLKNTYPVRIPTEAGEKTFMIDESIPLPDSVSNMQRLIRYELTPELLELKIISDKIVFRGVAKLHIVYLSSDGKLRSWDVQLPFSQYAQLDKEHETDSVGKFCFAVTNLELEQGEEENLTLKAGILAQYVVFDQQTVELTEDAYSNVRDLKPQFAHVRIPAQLDSQRQTLTARQTAPLEGVIGIDLSFNPEHPRLYKEENAVAGEMAGVFQMLYYDEDDALNSCTCRWEENWTICASADANVYATVQPTGNVQISFSGEGAVMECELNREVTVMAGRPLSMISGLELGDVKEVDVNRPSLILRRAGEDSLWNMAKKSGSTVEAIRSANNLQQEPDSNRILIIPVS